MGIIMIVKLMGMAAIMAGAAGMGVFKAAEFGTKIDQLVELERMTEYFRGEILLHHSTVAEASADIAKQVAQPLGSFLKNVSDRINRRTGEDLRTIWETEGEAVMRELSMDRKEREEFLRLGEKLGYQGKDMQEKTLNRYQMFLARKRSGLEDEQKEKMKLYRTLGVLGGLFLILLFV